MKKRLACFIFAAAMVLAMPMASFAAEQPMIDQSVTTNSGDNTRSVSTSSIGADRLSNTSGMIEAYATFTKAASKAVCTIYLQEKYNGSWRTATGLGTTKYTKTAFNTNSIAAAKTFTLISGKVYRGKIVFTDTINGTVYTKTRYTGSF